MQFPKRQSSPKRSNDISDLPVAKVVQHLEAQSKRTGALTPEALKIAHSRSSSETHLAVNDDQLDIIMGESPGDSDEDGLEMKRGPMVRKKSGELVKPALRASSHRRRPVSAPGTPTYPKAVHFNEDMEQVRHFLQVDRPMAVSAGSSPVEIYDSETDYPFGSDSEKKAKTIEWEIKLTNFPEDSFNRQVQPVRVEQIYLSKDRKNLIGVVVVANLSFEKYVTARFTLDYWKTTSEVAAEFANVKSKTPFADGFDRFQFCIRLSDLANLQNKTMYLCVRYNVCGQEHWDSNAGANYQIDFLRKVPTKPQLVKISSGSSGSIPRSRHTGTGKLPRPRSFPAGPAGPSDDEFSTAFESPFRLRKPGLGPANDQTQAQAAAAAASNVNRLANRYDFNASLHAALTTAQNALGAKSGLKLKTTELTKPAVAAPKQQILTPTPQSSPAPANKSRPDLNSAEYKDLIQKFCYFGSNVNSGNATEEGTPQPMASPIREEEIETEIKQADGVAECSSDDSITSSPNSSVSNSPPSPKAQLHREDSQISHDSKTSSRSSSAIRAMSPRLLPYRTPSPAVNSAYQEFPHQGLSVQSALC